MIPNHSLRPCSFSRFHLLCMFCYPTPSFGAVTMHIWSLLTVLLYVCRKMVAKILLLRSPHLWPKRTLTPTSVYQQSDKSYSFYIRNMAFTEALLKRYVLHWAPRQTNGNAEQGLVMALFIASAWKNHFVLLYLLKRLKDWISLFCFFICDNWNKILMGECLKLMG